MERRQISMTLFLMLLVTAFSSGVRAQTSAQAALEKIKALEGDWVVKTTAGQELKSSFRVTSGGGTVMQLMGEGREEMPTLYHMDNGRLMVTHYCAANNQPRMVLATAESSETTLQFRFLDVTNLRSPETGHMREVAFRFLGPDRLRQEWTYRENGKDTSEAFDLVRRK
jgi:hypothetical protein